MIEKPNREDLDKVIAAGSGARTEPEWVAAMMAAIRALLLKNPKRYRGYGPYWWLLKRMFIEAGDLSFGEHLDYQWIEDLDYGSPAYNLAAAFAYEDARFNSVNVLDAYHVMPTTDGDAVEFTAADEEMELR
ncbi:MAG: hypothetical protein ABIL58_23185 [Pseudomonadota bacterium]